MGVILARLNIRSPRLPTAAMQNTAEQLWVGEGQTLYLSNEDLMFEWTTGFATRSKNLDSLCLDKIVRAHVAPCRPHNTAAHALLVSHVFAGIHDDGAAFAQQPADRRLRRVNLRANFPRLDNHKEVCPNQPREPKK